MLIRNAVIDGYPGPVDLRLMHGVVQEIGVGLQKGLYESMIDLSGDELRPCPKDFPLPRKMRRSAAVGHPDEKIRPGTPEPLLRWRNGLYLGWIDQHSAD